MEIIRDDPVVHALESTGWPDGKEPDYPICPICHKECEAIYKNSDNEIVGCDECIIASDAWGESECFPEKE